MQIIADLEGTMCGPYGGCVGYFSSLGGARLLTSRLAGTLAPPSRRRLGERLRTRSGISGNGEQEQSHAQSRGAGGDVCQNSVAIDVRGLKVTVGTADKTDFPPAG